MLIVPDLCKSKRTGAAGIGPLSTYLEVLRYNGDVHVSPHILPAGFGYSTDSVYFQSPTIT